MTSRKESRLKASEIAELTLGVFEGQVIYTHVQILDEDGKQTCVARTLPEFQSLNE